MAHHNQRDKNNDRNQNTNSGSDQGRSNRGFASMDPDRQREIASEGGRAAHEKGTAHEFDSQSGREAGRKGGQSRAQNANNDSDRGSSDDGGM